MCGLIKENASHFGGRQIAAPTGTRGKSAQKTQSFCVEKLHCVFIGRQITVPKKSVTNQIF